MAVLLAPGCRHEPYDPGRTPIGAPSCHSPECVPDAEKRRVLRDSATMRAFAERAARLPPVPQDDSLAWDNARAAYYLAISDRPEYGPLLLRFAVEDPAADSAAYPRGLFGAAVYGLVRLGAAFPPGQARLRALALAPERPKYRWLTVSRLLEANDAAARAILREVPVAEMPPRLRDELPAVLAARPCKPGTWLGPFQTVRRCVRREPWR